MVYIIQTNISLDDKNKEKDFQSMMFKYSSWNDYKKDFLSSDDKCIFKVGTLQGCIKPRQYKIEKIIINDDYHFECIINNGYIRINVKAYKVNQEQFARLL